MLLPQLFRSLPVCMATPTDANSSPGQAARAPSSLSEDLRRSEQQHLLLPLGALLFAGEQEGAQGTATASGTASGGEPDPLTGPEQLGSSDSGPGLVAKPLLHGGRYLNTTPCSSQQELNSAIK